MDDVGRDRHTADCIWQRPSRRRITDDRGDESQIERCPRCRTDAHVGHEPSDDDGWTAELVKTIQKVSPGESVWQALCHDRLSGERRHLCQHTSAISRVEQTTRGSLVHDMNDRATKRAGVAQQSGCSVKRRSQARKRQRSVGPVLLLCVDDHQD